MGRQTKDEMLLCSNELYVAYIEARPGLIRTQQPLCLSLR